MAQTPVRGTPARGGRARTSLALFRERERDRGAVLPATLRAAVAAEMGQAFSPPYQVPIVVAVNGLLMAAAWFLLPRGWLFTLQSALAFPVVLSSWMYADVPATNVLAPDRIRVLAALGDGTMISRRSPPTWRTRPGADRGTGGHTPSGGGSSGGAGARSGEWAARVWRAGSQRLCRPGGGFFP